MDGYVKRSQDVVRVLEAEYLEMTENGISKAQAVENLKGVYGDIIECFAILDEKYRVIAATGGLTYDTSTSISINLDCEYKIYPDEKERLTSDLGSKVRKGLDTTGNLDQKIADVVFWYPYTLKNQQDILMIKCREIITLRSIVAAAFMLFVVGILIVIPILFLLISIISSFVSQRRIAKLLYWDPMTGGNNWMYVKMNGKKILAGHGKKSFAVVDLEFMKFRSYCTCHGVEEGENLLEKMDKYLQKQCNRRETCAHHSKANFFLCITAENREAVEIRLRRIFEGLSAQSQKHHIDFHAGVLYLDGKQRSENKKRKEQNVEILYQCAGMARASVANTEGDVIAFYSDEMLEAQLWQHKVEDMMGEALKKEEFLIYLQPKYNPVNNQLTAAEALVRWDSPTEGFISPGRFIPIFENSGFIKYLDDYMISHVAKLQARWLAQGKQIVPISVNVSRAHFANPDLAEHIRSLVDAYGIPHRFIEIELTESAFFDDKQMILDTVKKLQEYGFEVSMDDFGSGYSSLNSLKDLPLDILKLDAEFFRGEDSPVRGQIVVSEAIHLAKSLNMKIVAEGIERKEQVDFLAENGCDMIQGYYYAKPMPVNEFEGIVFGAE